MGGVNPGARRSRAKVAAVAAIVIGISCGRTSAPDDGGRGVAKSFLDEIRAGRIEPAWRETTVEFKSLMGSESLRDYARRHAGLKAPVEYIDSRPVDTGRVRLMEYRFRATPPAAKGSRKTPPPPSTIRVMVSLDESPPRVERLEVE